MPSQPSAMDESTSPFEAEEDVLPPPPIEEEPRLVKPEGVKSRFWVHFMRYDIQYHPEKKTTARCALCGKDISVKQGTGGLKNHLKFKHPEESAMLMVDHDEGSQEGAAAVHQSPMPVLPAATTSVRSPARGGTSAAAATAAGTAPARKKPRVTNWPGNNPYADITTRMDAEKRDKEKHLMEMWSLARREISELRKELKEEEDEDIVRELEGDIRVLKTRKATYAEMLGFPKDDGVVTAEHTQEI